MANKMATLPSSLCSACCLPLSGMSSATPIMARPQLDHHMSYCDRRADFGPGGTDRRSSIGFPASDNCVGSITPRWNQQVASDHHSVLEPCYGRNSSCVDSYSRRGLFLSSSPPILRPPMGCAAGAFSVLFFFTSSSIFCFVSCGHA